MDDHYTLTFRKLVRPEDLNPANRLFGGRLMQFADEAAALYAMCQLNTQYLVTLKVSEMLFKKPICSGDFLEFFARKKKIGKTSLTVELVVKKRYFDGGVWKDSQEMFTCEFVFVAVDEAGDPKRHCLSSTCGAM